MYFKIGTKVILNNLCCLNTQLLKFNLKLEQYEPGIIVGYKPPNYVVSLNNHSGFELSIPSRFIKIRSI